MTSSDRSLDRPVDLLTSGNSAVNEITPNEGEADSKELGWLPTSNSPSDIEERSNEASAEKAPFEHGKSKFQWVLSCVGLCLGAFLYGLDRTIAASVQGPILDSLGEITKLAWVGIGFSMGSVSIILLVGCCYGLFEIKYLIISSITIFEIGSAICGSAPTMNAMILGRVIAGMGGCGMYLGGLTYVSVFVAPRSRALYDGLFGISFGVGSIIGPIIGGGFAVSSATWRWAFYINLPLAALFSPVYFCILPRFNPQPDVPWRTKLAQIDWIGAVLNAIVFTLFQVVLTFSGSTWKWNDGKTIAIWVLFGAAVIAYAVQQSLALFTTPQRQLFPVRFLKSRTMVLLYTGMAGSATSVFTIIYYIPLFFQFVKGDTALGAAVRLLPYTVIYIFFIMLAGGIVRVVGRGPPFYTVGGAFMIIGAALMHSVEVDTRTSNVYGYEIILAIGAGLSIQIGYMLAVVHVERHEIQSAVGFMNVSQIGTTAIALGLADVIFQNRGYINLRDALQGYEFSERDLRDTLSGVQSAILIGGDSVVRAKAVAAIVKTIDSLWILSIVAGAVAMISGLGMSWKKLKLNTAIVSK